MYNTQQKYDFMKAQALSELRFSRYIALFNTVGDIERKWGTDVCAMTPELSGRCYRLYEREQAGLPLDFDGVAQRIIELEEFEGNFEAKFIRTKQMLKKDYNTWKTTF